MIDPSRAQVSVLIGLVSTEDSARIFETLASLDERQGDAACEVVLVDRRRDWITNEIARRFPAVRIIPCAADASLPAMRTMALDAAKAAIVAITEDHCVPCDNWLEQITAAMADTGVVAVGGVVENGVKDTALDWATFLCEYSYFSPPVTEGAVRILPGMNVAYRRDALAAVPRERLIEGFWETTLHQILLDQGGTFVSRNAMKMYHCKAFSLGLFARQRYIYSRYYAGLRFRPDQIMHRLSACAATVFLPPLLLWRMRKAASAKGLGNEFVRALPVLALFVVIWSAGEAAGYLMGAGNALAKIE